MLNQIKKIIPSFIKKKIKSMIKVNKFKEFKNTSVVLTKEALIKGIKKAGIKKGDTLFIHSSLKGLGYIEGGPQTIIDAFKSVIGNDGTLIFPVFTIDMSMEKTLKSNTVFCPKTSPSTVGSISNAFLKNEGVFRSLHPTHSVAAWGKHAEFITKDHHSSNSNFGKDTPFGRFLELNGKLLGLGIKYDNVTFYHTYEDLNLAKFPTVYLPKPFNVKIKNHKNEEIKLAVLCHNPEFHKTRIEKDPAIEQFFSNYFEKNKIATKTKIGQGFLWWMQAEDVINSLDLLYKQDKTIYKIK